MGRASFGELLPGEPLTQELADWADICLGNLPAKFLHGSEKLLWLQTNSAGVEEYVRPGVLGENTLLTNATGAYGLAISEYMLGVLLELLKKLELYRDAQKQGAWESLGSVGSVYGATVLVLGMGDIGGEFGQRCKALGARIIGVRRSKRPCPDYADEVHTLEDLDELLPQADVVAVTLPGTEATRGLLGRERMARIKDGAVLLNVGRGYIVDTEALCDALESGKLAGAGLDVTDPEPLPGDHRLWRIPTAVVTPPCVRVLPSEGDPPAHCEDHGGEPEAVLRRGAPEKPGGFFQPATGSSPEEEAMEVHYLDNSATTPVLPEAAQAAVELMTESTATPPPCTPRALPPGSGWRRPGPRWPPGWAPGRRSSPLPAAAPRPTTWPSSGRPRPESGWGGRSSPPRRSTTRS